MHEDRRRNVISKSRHTEAVNLVSHVMTRVLGFQRVKICRVVYKVELLSEPQIPSCPPLSPAQYCHHSSPSCLGQKSRCYFYLVSVPHFKR